MRILGIPVITVASPAVQQAGGPTARQRAEVIEGNLELLDRGQELCSQGEAIGELFLDSFYLRSGERACDTNQLGLLGAAEALQVQTVTSEAGLHGTTPERLAERWRALLERRLHFARHLLEPGVLGVAVEPGPAPAAAGSQAGREASTGA